MRYSRGQTKCFSLNVVEIEAVFNMSLICNRCISTPTGNLWTILNIFNWRWIWSPRNQQKKVLCTLGGNHQNLNSNKTLFRLMCFRICVSRIVFGFIRKLNLEYSILNIRYVWDTICQFREMGYHLPRENYLSTKGYIQGTI